MLHTYFQYGWKLHKGEKESNGGKVELEYLDLSDKDDGKTYLEGLVKMDRSVSVFRISLRIFAPAKIILMNL